MHGWAVCARQLCHSTRTLPGMPGYLCHYVPCTVFRPCLTRPAFCTWPLLWNIASLGFPHSTGFRFPPTFLDLCFKSSLPLLPPPLSPSVLEFHGALCWPSSKLHPLPRFHPLQQLRRWFPSTLSHAFLKGPLANLQSLHSGLFTKW